jgi:predicted nuclease of predicted toxin-antitoxin system
MRILLDECLDERLRHDFSAHDCQSCRFAGFKGLENGALLHAAEQAGFEVLITADQNMPVQQSLVGRRIAVIVLRAPSTNRRHLRGLAPEVLAALQTLRPGQLVRIGPR